MSRVTNRTATAVQLPPTSLERLERLCQSQAFQQLVGGLGEVAKMQCANAVSALGSAPPLMPATGGPAIGTRAQALTAALGLDEVAAVKLAVALELVPLAGPAVAIAPSVTRLAAAATTTEVRTAANDAVAVAACVHQLKYAEVLAEELSAATVDLGFSNCEVSRAGDTLRILGLDPSGRGLVTEIRLAGPGPMAIASEVLGAEPDCEELLARFDAVLARRGVQLEQRSGRPTGGVPQLDASAILAARRMQRPLRPAATSRQPRQRSPRTSNEAQSCLPAPLAATAAHQRSQRTGYEAQGQV